MGYYAFSYSYSDPAITYYVNNVTQGSAVVPPSGGFPVSIAGRNYLIDTSFEPYRREAFRHKSLQAQRQSLHFTNIPDDGTVSTEGLWRREARDWTLGEGQTYFDRKKSDDSRFYRSKGINPWSQWEITLLPDTAQRYGSATPTNIIKAVRCGSFVYIIDGSTLKFTSSWGTTPTTVVGLSGTILDACTDGYNIYVLTTNGFYTGIAGNADGVAKLVTLNLLPLVGSTVSGIIQYIGGRLIMATNNCQSFAVSGGTVPPGATLWDLTNQISTTASPAPIAYLTSAISTTTTVLSIDYLQIAEPNNTILYIEGEQVKVSGTPAVGATSITVIRGQNSTTAAAHAVGTPIYGPPIAATALKNNLFTHPNPTWNWTAITAGSSNLYFAGIVQNSINSDPACIYRSTIESNSTSTSATLVPGNLTYPVICLPFPTGEYPTSMRGYLNYIFIGTNKGIRMCETINALDPVGNTGDLKSGPLAPNITHIPSAPVTGIVGNDRYIYWAWNNYDTNSTGLGRLDLTTFIDTLSPAYASDLMVDGYGTTSSGAMSFLDWDPITDSPLMSLNSFVKQASNLTTNILEYGLLNAAITSTGAPTITVANENNISYPTTPFNICIPNTTGNAWEEMRVTAISGTTWTVTRGYNGTTPSTHLNAANVYADTVTMVGHNQFVVGDIIELDNFSNGSYNTASGVPATVLSANSSLFTISTLKISPTVGNEAGESEVTQGNSLPGTTGAGYEYAATGGYAKINNSSGVITPSGYIFTGDPNSCVPTATLDSGIITYGIPDYKNAVTLDFNITNTSDIYGNSNVDFQISTDGGSNIDMGTYTGTSRKASFSFNQQFGEEYEIFTTINSAKGLNTAGAIVNTSPTLTRWTLKALPGIPSGTQISAVILLYEPVEINGQINYVDPYEEYAFLEQLRQSQQIVTYVEGPFTAQVTIDVLDWLPERLRDIGSGGYHGDIVVYMKTIAG